MNIRLVSGDHLETAKVIARKVGILQEGDEEKIDSNKFAFMHADTFE